MRFILDDTVRVKSGHSNNGEIGVVFDYPIGNTESKCWVRFSDGRSDCYFNSALELVTSKLPHTIALDEIRKGDSIRVKDYRLDFTIEGVANKQNSSGMWFTDKDVTLTRVLSKEDYKITLLERLKPAVPDAPGTVVSYTSVAGLEGTIVYHCIATKFSEEEWVVASDRNDWVSIHSTEEINQQDWKLIQEGFDA